MTVSGPERFDRPVSPLAVAPSSRRYLPATHISPPASSPLLPLRRVSRHTGIKERCCSLKGFNGFSVRVDAQSDFAGAPVVGDSPPWKTRALIVGGNLCADRVQVSCIDGFERLCDTTVGRCRYAGLREA